MTHLFQTGDFALASGMKSKWRIECDALSPEDWDGIAAMLVEILPPFGSVVGVPRGGIPLARALDKYVTQGPVLIAEDVVTTGGSINRFRGDRQDAIGCCVFCRGTCPEWVTPLFAAGGELHDASAKDVDWDHAMIVFLFTLFCLGIAAILITGDQGSCDDPWRPD